MLKKTIFPALLAVVFLQIGAFGVAEAGSSHKGQPGTSGAAKGKAPAQSGKGPSSKAKKPDSAGKVAQSSKGKKKKRSNKRKKKKRQNSESSAFDKLANLSPGDKSTVVLTGSGQLGVFKTEPVPVKKKKRKRRKGKKRTVTMDSASTNLTRLQIDGTPPPK